MKESAAIMLQCAWRRKLAYKEYHRRREKRLLAEEAPPQQSKAGKMGGLLMKAKKDGSLEARVEKMETELGDDAWDTIV